MITAGAMRKLVRIEQRTSTQDAAGEPLVQWTLVCERRAQVVRIPGREIWSSAQRNARVPTTFAMRFPRNLTVLPQMRLICDGVLYDIVSAIDPDGMRAELQVTCLELVNEPIEGST